MSDHLDIAVRAAREAGKLLRENFGSELGVNAREAHDIKLELDVQAQDLIAGILLGAFPDHALYGEEGISGKQGGDWEWIVDPIDGTVNYFYSIPHFCISIALRFLDEVRLGVIYDPMRDELWTVERGSAPLLNSKPIRVSPRTDLSDAMVTVGFSKSIETINASLPTLDRMVKRARKCRMMGSAALDLAYVASGRLDAYIESSVSLWDIAAGVLLVESAGGRVNADTHPDNPHKYSIVAWNGTMDLQLHS